MPRRTERPSASPSEDATDAPAAGRSRRRMTMLVVAIGLATLVGGLAGVALYLLLGVR